MVKVLDLQNCCVEVVDVLSEWLSFLLLDVDQGVRAMALLLVGDEVCNKGPFELLERVDRASLKA